MMDQRRSYREILGVSRDAGIKEIKAQYRTLMKAHHPDLQHTQSEEEAKANDEICRIVVNAYKQLIKDPNSNFYEQNERKQREKPNSASQQNNASGWKSKYDPDYEPKQQAEPEKQRRKPITEEEQLYYSIFGKLFEDDPYEYYNEKNSHLRKEYEKKLRELRARKMNAGGTQSSRNQYSSGSGSGSNESDKTSTNAWLSIAFGLGLVSVATFMFVRWMIPKKKTHAPIRNITEETVQSLVKMSAERTRKHLDKLANSYREQHPPMLKYPSDLDPGIVKQLLKYSILQNINLYEASPVFFDKHEEFATKQPSADKLLLINHVKPNTLMTMALEAERCLHSIYVNRNDVLKELKEKGRYDPPGVFFRYYGFNYFKIREGMPLNLSNYNGEMWISLFDLFFKYYSPLFVKKSDYYEYTTHYGDSSPDQPRSEKQFLGSVHINHRAIPNIFLRPEDKNVFMWVPAGKIWEDDYRQIWEDYYRDRRR